MEWQNLSGVIGAYVNQNGNFRSANIAGTGGTSPSSITFGAGTLIETAIAGNVVLTVNNSGGATADLFRAQSSGNSLFVINSTGNVGIGTTAPASKLNISGSPVATANYGTLSIGGGAFDGSTSGKFVGNLPLSGTSIAVNEATGFNGELLDLQIGGVSAFRVDNTNISSASRGLSFSGTFTSTLKPYVFNPTFTQTGTSQVVAGFNFTPTYNQSSATGVANTDLLINRTQTNLGTTPGAQYLIDTTCVSIKY